MARAFKPRGRAVCEEGTDTGSTRCLILLEPWWGNVAELLLRDVQLP